MLEFTNNEREISIPHEAFALCVIENFEFIVSEPVQVNPHASRVNIFIIQIEYTAQRNTALKPLWCNDSGVLSLHVRLEWQTI